MKKEDRFDLIFKGGEQPIDVAYTVLALKVFHILFPTEGYGERMELAFNWFLGQNPLHQTIYNPCTSGCYDGLELNNVNLNQGAESRSEERRVGKEWRGGGRSYGRAERRGRGVT